MKIISSPRVRRYELTYLLPASLTSGEVTKSKDAVEKLLGKHSIKILSQDDWGKKELAYPIKYKSDKQYEAFYFYLVIEAEAQNTVSFEKDLYLKQEVIRHLIVLEEREATNLEDLKAE